MKSQSPGPQAKVSCCFNLTRCCNKVEQTWMWTAAHDIRPALHHQTTRYDLDVMPNYNLVAYWLLALLAATVQHLAHCINNWNQGSWPSVWWTLTSGNTCEITSVVPATSDTLHIHVTIKLRTNWDFLINSATAWQLVHVRLISDGPWCQARMWNHMCCSCNLKQIWLTSQFIKLWTK